MNHGSHDMGDSMSETRACKISMLWNWDTVDACFITDKWQIDNEGMFIGSCFAVIFLGMLFEALRRGQREFDRAIARRHAMAATAAIDSASKGESLLLPLPLGPVRPTVFQHTVRALLHISQFIIAYLSMLLAMYYNGYIIICIFVGALLGYLAFAWDIPVSSESYEGGNAVTGCCG